MADPRIPLKNPWLAAVLAYMVPGAGHFYQGRRFKGLVYFVCISGMFLYGLRLSDWTALNMYHQSLSDGRVVSSPRSWGFIAQAGIGTPAAIAFLQTQRFRSDANTPVRKLEQTVAAPFRGLYFQGSDDLKVVGDIVLEPDMTSVGPSAKGRLTGFVEGRDGELEPLELQLGGGFEMEQPVSADARRTLRIRVAQSPDEPQGHAGSLEGTIPRAVLDRVGVPPTSLRLEEMHGTAGKWFELALVYTWIAGLLNVLAVWDAFDGPAYGYGDEEPDEDETPAKQPESAALPTPVASPQSPANVG